MNKIFRGDLYYDDSSSDRINVESFIVRNGSIGFSLISETKAYGRFKVSGTASLAPSGTYEAPGLLAQYANTKCSATWDIAFEVGEEGPDYLYVKGFLVEAFNKFPFEGELENATNQ